MANITGRIAPPVDFPIPGGTPVNGTLDVQLCGFGSQVPRAPGYALLGRITEQNITVDVDGNFEFTLTPNDQIDPAGTYYTVVVRDGNGDIAQINAYLFIGEGPFDLTVFPPFDPNQPPPPLPPLLTNQLLNVAFSTFPNFPGDTYTAFRFDLSGDTTGGTITGMVPGNLYTFIITQDAAGGHTFVWPAGINNGATTSRTPNVATIQTFIAIEDGTLYAIAPGTWTP